jgi:hypothetical protein
MADKKITQLPLQSSQFAADDLLPLVTDVDTTPANKKIKVKDFLKLGFNLLSSNTAGLTLTTGTANATAQISTTANTHLVSHAIRLYVNGAYVWLLASNVAPF